MSRIIKASEFLSEPFAAFDFSEIADSRSTGHPGTRSTEVKEPEEAEHDPLMELEAMIQQRLLETERRAQELEQEGYEKGYAQGLKDGTEFGRKSMQVAKEQFEELLVRLMALPRDAFKDYRKWFVAACLAVSRHIARRELQTDPELLVDLMDSVLREAEESQGATIYLHPKDLELLSNHSALQDMVKDSDRTFTVRPDPRMSRGGCRLESNIQLIDATLENRLSLIEQSLLAEGEEEDNDATDE